jgi:hypothetical protein
MTRHWWDDPYYPPRVWSREDREAARRAGVRVPVPVPPAQELGNQPVVAPLPRIAGGWFRPRHRRGTDSATSKAIDNVLDDLGVQPRRRAR